MWIGRRLWSGVLYGIHIPPQRGPLWDQSSNMDACLHNVPQREAEREEGEDGVKRKEQDTMMERAERE